MFSEIKNITGLAKKSWQFETSGVEGNVKLFGVDIFEYPWKDTGESIKVTDPIYNVEKSFHLFKVVIGEEEHSFVAGEFSNNIWGFYLFKY